VNLFLQHPGLLGLLALAAVPLLVHLVSRARPPTYPFSNTEFLRRVLKLQSRFRKPRDLLLLLMRTLAILALVAAILGPLLLSDDAPLPGERRSLIAIVDRSASMAARDGASARIEAAAGAAAELLREAKPELANLVWLDANPRAAFPEPGPNLDFLDQQLRAASARPEAAAVEAAIELAVRQLAPLDGRREIHIFSDFQRGNWQRAEPIVPAGIDLHFHPLPSAPIANLAVSGLEREARAPIAGRELAVRCRVANHSDEPRRANLTLDAGGSRQSQPLDLPPRGEGEARFVVRRPAAGLMPLRAEIDGDAFPADDRRFAALRVREALRLAVAGPADHPARPVLARFTRALPWLELEPEARGGELQAVLAWDGADPDALRQLAANGTAVVVFPRDATPAALAALLAADPAGGASLAEIQSADPGWQLRPEVEHPAFRLFADGAFGNPLEGRVRERVALAAPASATVLASFDDGRPALLVDPELPLLVAAFSLDPAASTWPDQANFVPALAELLLHLSPGTGDDRFEIEPGASPQWLDAESRLSVAPTLEAPDGSTIPVTSDTTPAGTRWRAEATAATGIHRWLASGQPVHYSVVNFPPIESDLRPLESLPAVADQAAGTLAAERRAALGSGLPLWPWLAATALLLLLAESLLGASRAPSTRPA